MAFTVSVEYGAPRVDESSVEYNPSRGNVKINVPVDPQTDISYFTDHALDRRKYNLAEAITTLSTYRDAIEKNKSFQGISDSDRLLHLKAKLNGVITKLEEAKQGCIEAKEKREKAEEARNKSGCALM